MVHKRGGRQRILKTRDTLRLYPKDTGTWYIHMHTEGCDSTIDTYDTVIIKKIISGYVYQDANSDCLRNDSEETVKNVALRLYSTAGTFLATTYTDENGFYSFFGHTPDSCRVRLDTAGLLYTACNYDALISDKVYNSASFGLHCSSYKDLGIVSAITQNAVFPGREHQLSLTLKNMGVIRCNDSLSCTVSIIISGPVAYKEPAANSLIPAMVSGDTIRYDIPNFYTINPESDILPVLITDTNALVGDFICIKAEISCKRRQG